MMKALVIDRSAVLVAKLRLRPATRDDFPAILALLEAAHLPANELEDWIEHVVVAEQGRRIVGCGGLEVYAKDAAGLVRSMAVEEGLRGTKLGRHILEWVLAHARELGLRRLYLFTMAARDFYAHFDFADAALEEFPPSARRSAQFRFVREHGQEWGIKAMARDVD